MHHLIGSASTRWFCWHNGQTILAAIVGHMRRLNAKILFYMLARVL
jgi:translation initiation factor IF-1